MSTIKEDIQQWEQEALEQHDRWMKLLKEDPEAFEKEIQQLRDAIINEAPQKEKLKLKAQQARWDGIMNRVGKENRFAMAQALFNEQLCEKFNPALQELNNIMKAYLPKEE